MKKFSLFNEKQLKDLSNKIHNVCNKINEIIKKKAKKHLMFACSPTKASLLLKMSRLSSREIEFTLKITNIKLVSICQIRIPIIFQ